MNKAILPIADTPKSGARLVSNSRWNFVSFGLSLLINFAAIPIVISFVGLEAFGIAGLIVAIYAPFMLVGTVIGQSLVKELSPLAAAGDFIEAAPVLSASLALCLVCSLLVVVLLTLAGEASLSWTGLQSSAAVNWPLAFLIAGVGWFSQQFTLVLQGTFAAAQRYRLLAGVSLVATVVNASSTLVGSMLWPGYFGFLLGSSIGFLISLFIWIAFVRIAVPSLFPLTTFGCLEVYVIAEFGKWQGVAHFAGAIGNQIDRYVLGILAPLSVVGQYNVAMRLQEVVHMGLLKVTEVLFPHFAVTANDPLEHRAKFYIQAAWIFNVLGVAALVPLIPLSNDLITLWVSKEAAIGGAPMLQTLAGAGLLGCGVNVYYFLAIGTGQSARIAKLTVLHAILTVLITTVAINVYGSVAAGIGYLIANIIRLIATVWLSSKFFAPKASWDEQLMCTLAPLLVGLLAGFILSQFRWLKLVGWGQFLAAYFLISFTLVVLSIFATSVSKKGRNLVTDTWLGLRRVLIVGN